MNILIISAFPPNQKTAGQDYTRRLILDLLSRNHKISLIYAEYPKHDIELPNSVEILATIKPSLKECLRESNFHPFFTKRFNQEIVNLLNSVSKNFDILYFDFSQVHIYSLFIKHPRKILMCHDVIAQKFTRKGKLQLPFIKNSESKCLRSANKIITFSKKDCDFISNFYGLKSVFVNFYLKNEKFTYSNIEILENTFCFYGAWNREENTEALLWFIKNVLPSVSSKLQFVIIGGGLSENLKRYISKIENFRILGFVDNPIIEIAKCQALIAPLHKGAGVKVKVIDALTSGTKVIGTDVAFEGIEDNSECKLFLQKGLPREYEDLLNNWITEKKEVKQSAAIEFFTRYNENHFPDLL